MNIGYSCNLVLQTTKLFYLVKLSSVEAYEERLQEIYDDIITNSTADQSTDKLQYKDASGEIVEIALVMDGPSFKYFNEKNENHRKWLLAIG